MNTSEYLKFKGSSKITEMIGILGKGPAIAFNIECTKRRTAEARNVIAAALFCATLRKERMKIGTSSSTASFGVNPSSTSQVNDWLKDAESAAQCDEAFKRYDKNLEAKNPDYLPPEIHSDPADNCVQ